ncbi:MAG: hypothetical protein GZ089_08665 [Aromatoleum sp.]|nr:hypothetical protein [Aromatoleum sp.]
MKENWRGAKGGQAIDRTRSACHAADYESFLKSATIVGATWSSEIHAADSNLEPLDEGSET